jgi:hypothetical protein
MGGNTAKRMTVEEQERIEEGKPVITDGGIRITKNKLTG